MNEYVCHNTLTALCFFTLSSSDIHNFSNNICKLSANSSNFFPISESNRYMGIIEYEALVVPSNSKQAKLVIHKNFLLLGYVWKLSRWTLINPRIMLDFPLTKTISTPVSSSHCFKFGASQKRRRLQLLIRHFMSKL